MDNAADRIISQTRRQFMRSSSLSLGAAAFGGLLQAGPSRDKLGRLSDALSFAPRAKRVIYLFQNGAPTHGDLFDYKPRLHKLHATPVPEEYLGCKRFSTMTGNPRAITRVLPIGESTSML